MVDITECLLHVHIRRTVVTLIPADVRNSHIVCRPMLLEIVTQFVEQYC